MSELRKDPVTNTWVITLNDKDFAPAPGSNIPLDLPGHDPLCPFCTGNEDKSGREIHTVRTKEGGWKVRVIPNNKPYLKVETQLKKQGKGFFDVISGTGANEVIVEAPAHNVDFDNMTHEHVLDVINTYKDRINDLKKDMRMEYVLIFKNRGKKAGAVSWHLHSQLMGMPVIPKKVQEEIDSAKVYFDFKSRCVYCDLIDHEISMKERVVKDTEYFTVITPFASQACFEMWVIPKKHSCHFHEIDQAQAKDLAGVLKDSIGKLNRALNCPSYNYMIHTAPIKAASLGHYHWHMEILPRVKSIAGFEWGSGFYINPTLPEEAAAYLRGL
jgi:UDPglucose--hexose-1-phosphate uridylyltransferase